MQTSDTVAPGKSLALMLLVLAEVAGMTLWFATAAIIPSLTADFALSSGQVAALSSLVQGGFVIGALLLALSGLPDRVDARHLFAMCAIIAALANASLLVLDPAGGLALLARALTGAALAGVYPVGIRLAAAWGEADRGFLVGLLVGALTLGSALPYLVSFLGGLDWRLTIIATSAMAASGALLVLASKIGPFLPAAQRFKLQDLASAWRDRRLRAVYLGYFGHMVELYAMWAWLATALAVGFAAQMPADAAQDRALAVTFLAITAGALGCVLGGRLADRYGRARLAMWAMAISGSMALLTGATLGISVPLTTILALLWGLTIIPDSPQFSALVADFAPKAATGSLLTLQTALGFALTAVTVQMAPMVADMLGWDSLLMLLAIGPLFGIICMRPVLVRPR